MLIDAIFVILMVLACWKGLRKGFIVAIFSVLGFIIGIAAALKLSAVVAARLSTQVNGGAKWLPVVSFLLVFIAIAFLVNFCGKLIQKTFETVMLGWANRLAGALLYMLLYSIIFSVFLFYAVQLNFIKVETTAASVVFPYLLPLAPKVINGFGAVIPLFKDMFEQLQQFFGGISNKV
jgi:membrane protein required for colicin V production